MSRYNILLIIMIIGNSANAQPTPREGLDSLISQFAKKLRNDSRERIVLHIDKCIYSIGETVWFKAYCLNALSQRPVRYSNTVFVDLVNDRDSIITRLLLNLKQQRLEGNISLGRALPEGYYWLRAYTKKLLREDSNRVLIQPLYIINPGRPDQAAGGDMTVKQGNDLPQAASPTLQFFPEGGAITTSTANMIAFRATDATGTPMEVSGWVADSRDSVVAKFKTEFPGVGKFDLSIPPAAGQYTAHIVGKDKKERLFALPPPDANRIRLSVLEQTDLAYRVKVVMGDAVNPNALTYLLGVCRDRICFAAMGKGRYEANIPKKNFPAGAISLLLFNQEKKLISDRPLYNDKNDLVVTIAPDKENFGPREKVNLSITVSDATNQPVTALLSLSATDDRLAFQPSPDDKINDAAYQDLMLLTAENSYRARDANTDAPISVADDSNSDGSINGISGKVLTRKKLPAENLVVSLFSNQRTALLGADTTDKNGAFHIKVPDYYDSVEFIAQATNLEGKQQDVTILFAPPALPQFNTPPAIKQKFRNLQAEINRFIKNHKLDTFYYRNDREWLKEVVVSSKREMPANYDKSKRVSSFSYIITGDRLEKGGVNNIGNALFQVPGLHRMQGYLIFGGPNGFVVGPSDEPLLIMDGVAVDYDGQTGTVKTKNAGLGDESSPLLHYLSQYSFTPIDFIEVLSGPEAAAYGVRGGHGVILINTAQKKYDATENEDSGWKKYLAKGYYPALPFIGPDYGKEEIKRSAHTDLRSTIYWNGTILTDKDGHAATGFFTADAPTTYTIILKGITAGGEMIYKKIKLERRGE